MDGEFLLKPYKTITKSSSSPEKIKIKRFVRYDLAYQTRARVIYLVRLICMYIYIYLLIKYVPSKERGQSPGQQTDDHRSGLGAHVAGPQWFANGVIPFEADGQYGQHRSVSYRELDERHRFTCNQKH